jgi:hypothetical protein
MATCVVLPLKHLLVFEIRRWQGAETVVTANKARCNLENVPKKKKIRAS